MRIVFIALAATLLLVTIGLLGVGLLTKNRSSSPDTPPLTRGEEAVCLTGQPLTNGTRLVQFWHANGTTPDPVWMQPPSASVTKVSMPAPARSLDLAQELHLAQPVDDCLILLDAFSFFQRVYGENPVGDQAAIVQAMCGANPKNISFLSPQHPKVTDDWKILDRWGNPFFFHQLSGTDMEVISMGPDGELYTDDDSKAP